MAYKQSIMPLTSSNLFWRLKLMKLVSMRTRYGGTSAVLCCRKSDEATCGLRAHDVSAVSMGEQRRCNVRSLDSFFLLDLLFLLLLELIFFSVTPNELSLQGRRPMHTDKRASLGFRSLFTCANLRVFLAFPYVMLSISNIFSSAPRRLTMADYGPLDNTTLGRWSERDGCFAPYDSR